MTTKNLHAIFSASKGICTDTRKIEEGTLFFALKGDNFNGNAYAISALKKGCTYAVVDEVLDEKHENLIQVDSVLKTLQDLANFHRKQFDIPVLGITGSNGKTTTKELIGAVLSKKYNVLITEGNLNNHLGVPFTLLRLTENHDFAVIEMGASRPGDIQELVEIAEPNFGIITNIGAAHIEGMGSIEGIIETKTALYRWIESNGGRIFVNAEDEVLQKHLPSVDMFTYGERNGTVQGTLDKLTPFVNFTWSSSVYTSPIIETKLVGRYNFTNFLASAAIGTFFEVDPVEINDAIANYQPSNNRSQVQKTERNTLIVDCYNANATSMKAAIESFKEVEQESKIAILGDMLELGNISAVEHQKIVSLLADSNIKTILVGGEFGKSKHDNDWYPSTKALLATENVQKWSGYLILLKGSRGIKLEELIPQL